MLLTVMAMLAAGAPVALAENPEVLPTPTTKEPLSFTGEGGAGKLKTVGGLAINCLTARTSGSFTATRTGEARFELVGCRESKTKAACNASEDFKEVVLIVGGVHRAALNCGSLEPGIAVTRSSSVLINCGLLLDEVLGSAIGLGAGITSSTKQKPRA